MPELSSIVKREPSTLPTAVLRETKEWGLVTADLVNPPMRLSSPDSPPAPVVEQGVDARRLANVPSPAELLQKLPDGDNWSAQTRRTVARLWSCFIVCEDPQRRLDAREVSTLAHQVSLVRHVLDHENLRRVLIADEVGLGKTVEVGLILKELLEKSPHLRILYLAPARLVSNVRREFDRMKLGFRQWSATDADARLTDHRIIASIHRAVHPRHFKSITESQSWDMVVVDECHHLSDWAQGGGDPKEKFKLVRELLQRQSQDGRVVLLSGTPHQGHGSRFANLIGLLKGKEDGTEQLTGRVIYRTKDDVRDWDGNLLFPRRDVKEPLVVDLGPGYKAWISNIHNFFRPTGQDQESNRRRAAGWRCAQALQWAASSPQAGVGYLVRQAIRAGWTVDDQVLRACIAALRPYRGGTTTEPVEQLFERIRKEVGRQDDDGDIEDIETIIDDAVIEEAAELSQLLAEGLELLSHSPDVKWEVIKNRILDQIGDEKVVLFAQPIETVTAFASYLERTTGKRPALIIGGQSDVARENEIESFRLPTGPQFLVSSRAGGEGINLQISRRLVHIDVPWNPMDMEQRVGRVHRFGSRKTIVVDTLVVKDSREEHAYRVAREKLRLITQMMVTPEKFEQVFARVMCLVPSEELQNILANGPVAPLTQHDQETLAKVVHEGFAAWQDFDRQFAESQKQIRQQDPGLSTWKDVAAFLQNHAKWKAAEDFVKQKFAWTDGELESIEEPTTVVISPDGRPFACSDQGGIPVFGPNDELAEQLGVNLSAVRQALHTAAFPTSPAGAFYIRWPSETPFPEGMASERFFLLFFMRQSVRTAQSGWIEGGLSMHIFALIKEGQAFPLTGRQRRMAIDGLVAGTPRVKAPPSDDATKHLVQTEQKLTLELQRPTDEELAGGVRHAVWPIGCGLVDLDR